MWSKNQFKYSKMTEILDFRLKFSGQWDYVFSLKLCAAFVHKCQKQQNSIGNNLNPLFWTEINEYKNIGVGWPREVFTNALSTSRNGILEICFPILGRIRDRDKVEWKSAEIYGGAVWTTASCSEHFRGKVLKLLLHHTDGINHMADSWLLI